MDRLVFYFHKVTAQANSEERGVFAVTELLRIRVLN